MLAYLSTAIRAAIEAGEAIMRIYDGDAAGMEIEHKADNSPLTLADRKAHAIITEHLAKTPFPILSEEGRHAPYAERSRWDKLWVVDPLDGTKEFIRHNGEFTVNIALVENGTPRTGVIYVPATRTLYYGDDTAGAWRMKTVPQGVTLLSDLEARAERLPRKKEKAARAYTVVASRSHLSPETAACIRELEARYGRVETRSAGSSLKFCLVAEGTADFYPRLAPTMEWDTAAGDAILRAAGGTVTDKDCHRPLTYNKPDLYNPFFEATAPEV